MATTEQLTAWLAEAETALHQLTIGGGVVSVSSGSGKSVTYTAADAGKLAAYVDTLKRQLGLSVRRPFRPILG